MLSSVAIEHNVYKRRLIGVDTACLGISSYSEIQDKFREFDEMPQGPVLVAFIGACIGFFILPYFLC